MLVNTDNLWRDVYEFHPTIICVVRVVLVCFTATLRNNRVHCFFAVPGVFDLSSQEYVLLSVFIFESLRPPDPHHGYSKSCRQGSSLW